MAREPTLDEFGRDDGESEAPEGDRDATGEEHAPAPITCEWRPDGSACEACGATVERRWRDGDARVCADCKEW